MLFATLLPLLGLLPLAIQATPTSPELTAVRHTMTAESSRLYDVKDLVSIVGWRPKAEQARFEASGQSEALYETHRLREFILGIGWDEATDGALMIRAIHEGILEVSGSPAAQEYVESFLLAQRRLPGLIVMELLLVEMPAGHLAELGIEDSATFFESATGLAKLEETLRSDGDVEILGDAALAVPARSYGDLSVSEQVAYVKDYKLQRIEPGRVELLDPIVGFVEEGVWISTLPLPLPGGSVHFDLDINYAVLQRPIPTLKTDMDGRLPREVEIGLPELKRTQIRSAFGLQPGAGALIVAASPDDQKICAVLFKYVHPALQESPQLAALFHSMHAGTYTTRWFPPLTWQDIPALLERAKSTRLLTSFPTNPLSSQSMTECPEGVIALWLIEGLREEGHLPSLNPLLVSRTKQLDFSMQQQLDLLPAARAAYQTWWTQAQGDASTAPPLKSAGLSWY